MTREAFDAALVAGTELVPLRTDAGKVAEELLSAEQLETRTSVPASWWEQAAREGRIPHRRIGRYVRFKFGDVERHFAEQPTDSHSLATVRRWRKSGS
jgi:hypothetical protein